LEQLIADGILADLVSSGCRILECACGPCIGVGQVPCHNGIAVRTSNRNFPGRSGNNDASVYLVSPETAAATAITGCITDPREVFDVKTLADIREPQHYMVDDSMFITPDDVEDRHAVEVIKGPNISELPMRGPVLEKIEAGVVIKLGDNITTDDIIPGGSSILKFIANIPEFAKYTFCYTDPDFVARAQRMGQSIIVGGENYGQGSSREHAAMLPMYLGTQAVIAKSYARIHKENLFNYGILPLIFKKPEDYEKISQEDQLVIDQVLTGIDSGSFIVSCPEKGYSFEAVLEASDFDKEVLRRGGALNYLAEKIR
ncbi:MAG: aconitase family protein, partial [Emergencia sp.]